MSDLKIGVAGASGRMGRMLVREIMAAPGCVLSAASEGPGHAALGDDAGIIAGLDTIGVTLADDASALFSASDAVIDFTAPKATALHAAQAAEHNTAHIIGTTGLNEGEEVALHAAAKSVPIVWAPNMSLGVNLLFDLARRVTGTLGTEYDIEIVEMHHAHKVDAPSGTSLALGRAVAEGRGVDLDDVAVKSRDGLIGPRQAGDIGFATLRGGDVVGDHTVVFAGPGERVELTHKANDRAIYAKGAVRAALWARENPPGLYGMADVLGIDD